MIVACHQPNFFPWLGYFHKIRWAGTFVLLDDANIQKTGGSVTNRASLAPGGKQTWLTAPIDRSFSGDLPINRVRFSDRAPFRKRLLATLKTSYSRAPFFAEMWTALAPIVESPEPCLGAYNIHALRSIVDLIGLPAKMVVSSSLGIDGTSTERLVEIVARVSGDTYLYGGGAKAYLDESLFVTRGIRLQAQGFQPPLYPRGNQPSIGNLSILDALFFLGPAGTRVLLDAPLPDTGRGPA